MKSAMRGKRTSAPEVMNITPQGFWMLLDARELFVSFKDFPWFADAAVNAIADVRRPSAHHLYWPKLDVDLAVESIEHAERYPLVSGLVAPKSSRSRQVRELVRPARSSGKRRR